MKPAQNIIIILLFLLFVVTCIAAFADSKVVYEKPDRTIIKGLVFITVIVEEKEVTVKKGKKKTIKEKHQLFNYELLTGDIFQTSEKLKGVPDLRPFDERHRKLAYGRDALSVTVPPAQAATPFVVGAWNR